MLELTFPIPIQIWRVMRHGALMLALASSLCACTSNGDPSDPSEQRPEVVVLLEDMAPELDASEDVDVDVDVDADPSGCGPNEVELVEADIPDGSMLESGCYTVCSAQSDCSGVGVVCIDTLGPSVCGDVSLRVSICGDGRLTQDEACDGDCPEDVGQCPAPSDACATAELLGDADSCTAECVERPIEACSSGDGCCPESCTAREDIDCEAPATTGQACASARECDGAECVDTYQYAGGYCLGACTTDAECAGDGVCLPSSTGGGSRCFDRCEDGSDCREAYVCQAVDATRSICLPPFGRGPSQIGSPCESAAVCGADEICVTRFDGFKDGMCTNTCQTSANCAADFICLAPDPVERIGLCVPRCTQDTTCRDGYACFPAAPGQGGCLPAGMGARRGGQACEQTYECTGRFQSRCLPPEAGFVDGFCLVGCTNDQACAPEGHCVRANPETALCMPSCQTDADCRAVGYVCGDLDGDGRTECTAGGTGQGGVGDECRDLGDCDGGQFAACLGAYDNQPDYIGGYCTLDCDEGRMCPTGTHCTDEMLPEPSKVCLKDCTQDSDCRAGYACQDVDSNGTPECAPEP